MSDQEEWLALARQIGLIQDCRKWTLCGVEMIGVQWAGRRSGGEWDAIEYAQRCHPLSELREIVQTQAHTETKTDEHLRSSDRPQAAGTHPAVYRRQPDDRL